MKKITMVIVAMLLVALTAGAVAETVFPSKTVQDIVQVSGMVTETGEATDMVITVVEETETVTQEFTAIAEHVKEAPLVTYFPPVVQEEIRKALPETVVVENLVAYEVAPVTCINYTQGTESMVAKISFPTVYKKNQQVVTMLGIPVTAEDGTVTMQWLTLPTIVDEDGNLLIDFSAAALAGIDMEVAMMMVLSEPMTEE